MLATQAPLPQYTNADGSPLNGGQLFFGTANGNPETSPITVYWDAAGTQPAAQPISVKGGYAMRNGTPAAVYVSGDYSLTIKSVSRVIVLYVPNGASFSNSLASQIDLASPSRTKGSSLVAYVHSGFGAVPTTVQAQLDSLVYAENYRLASDLDDTLSIQRIMNLGLSCGLRAGKTYTISNLLAVAGTAIVAVGGRALFTVAAGANNFGLKIDVNKFTLSGVNFDGGDATDFKSFPNAAIGTRCGVIVGAPYDTGRNLSDCSISDCDFVGFDKAGIWGREVMFGATIFGKKVSLHNVSARRCYYGIWYDQRFEYVCTTNSYAYECRTGLYNQAGNNSFAACQSNYCYDNFMLEYGYNDGHGQAVGCSFNHAFGGHNIFAKNIGNGFTFVGVSCWFGNIEIYQSYGISIRNSVIANLAITVTGGGVNNVDENYFVVAVSKVFVGNVFTTFRRNRDTYQATTVNQEPNYADLWMVGKTSTAVGALQINTAMAELNLTYGTAKWMGQDLAALQIFSSRAVIQKTGIVKTTVLMSFSTAAAAQTVRMNLVKYDRTGVTRKEVLTVGVYAPASTAGLSIGRVVEWEFEYGEQIAIEMQTTSATGYTLDAVDVRHALIY